jgi:opacity protein-like surface antigen
MKTISRSILALVLSIVLVACSAQAEDSAQYETRVLFIGNSHTFHNDVPEMFQNMARTGGYSVMADMEAHGGWTLLDHAQSVGTMNKIRGADWDFVVLQEQSDVPTFSSNRDQDMFPAIRGLHNEISARGAETILFMTWGHRDGSLAEGVGGYSAESAAIEAAYVKIGDELGIPIAPVGVAWWNAMRGTPSLNLWLDDGNHATKEGSYLAASVLYNVILGQSPSWDRALRKTTTLPGFPQTGRCFSRRSRQKRSLQTPRAGTCVRA